MKAGAKKTITLIICAYNEEDVIDIFYERLTKVINSLPFNFVILFVNDGSTDCTAERLSYLRDQDERVALLDLSRNFGKEIALTAGIDYALGDAVIILDADLQDPPELISDMIAEWQRGFDVVYARRQSRAGETWLKKFSAFLFYRMMKRLTGRIAIPTDTGDFRLMSRRSLDAVKQIRERHRLMRGLFTWIGFKQTEVPFDRAPRAAGETKYDYWTIARLSLDGITSFSFVPLRLATYLGLAVALMAFVYALIVVFKTIAYGTPVAGYPSLMVVILFLGGVQLLSLGIIGEYLGRIFDETKRRPLYFVESFNPARSRAAAWQSEMAPEIASASQRVN